MKMKFFITILFSFLLQFGFAETTPVTIKYTRKDKRTTPIKRVPMMLPIEVVYDDEANRVDVVGDDSLEAVVYLYDQSGAVVGYSSTLNASFYVSAPGSYTLLIEGDGWTGDGYVEI